MLVDAKLHEYWSEEVITRIGYVGVCTAVTVQGDLLIVGIYVWGVKSGRHTALFVQTLGLCTLPIHEEAPGVAVAVER